jgi:hypothetical protein
MEVGGLSLRPEVSKLKFEICDSEHSEDELWLGAG